MKCDCYFYFDPYVFNREDLKRWPKFLYSTDMGSCIEDAVLIKKDCAMTASFINDHGYENKLGVIGVLRAKRDK